MSNGDLCLSMRACGVAPPSSGGFHHCGVDPSMAVVSKRIKPGHLMGLGSGFKHGELYNMCIKNAFFFLTDPI